METYRRIQIMMAPTRCIATNCFRPWLSFSNVTESGRKNSDLENRLLASQRMGMKARLGPPDSQYFSYCHFFLCPL
jgi:hypothetical protein